LNGCPHGFELTQLTVWLSQYGFEKKTAFFPRHAFKAIDCQTRHVGNQYKRGFLGRGWKQDSYRSAALIKKYLKLDQSNQVNFNADLGWNLPPDNQNH